MPDVLQERYDTLNYYMERGQAISGKVKNFWGKDASEANLILLSNTGLVQIVHADTNGRFMIDGIAFPDSTRFMLQGKSKRGRSRRQKRRSSFFIFLMHPCLRESRGAESRENILRRL